MENLIIPQVTRETPSINFDFETGVLTIGDESLPEDAKFFYGPIIEKLEEYLATSPPKIIFEMKMVYFNSSSSKKLMDMFELFLDHPETDTIVKWYYEDDDMKDDGDEFVFVLEYKLKFEFIFVNKGAS